MDTYDTVTPQLIAYLMSPTICFAGYISKSVARKARELLQVKQLPPPHTHTHSLTSVAVNIMDVMEFVRCRCSQNQQVNR